MEAWYTVDEWVNHQDRVWFYCYDELPMSGIVTIKKQNYLFFFCSYKPDKVFRYYIIKLTDKDLEMLNEARNVNVLFKTDLSNKCQIMNFYDNEDRLTFTQLTDKDFAHFKEISDIDDKFDYDWCTKKKLPKDKLF